MPTWEGFYQIITAQRLMLKVFHNIKKVSQNNAGKSYE